MDVYFNDKQWWITGWNPEYVDKVDVKKLVSVGCIDFAGHEDMYDALQTNMKSAQYKAIRKYICFDDSNCCVWLLWN